MKHAIGAAATILILLLFCVLTVNTVQKEVKNAVDLAKAAYHAEEKETAITALQKASSFWISKEKFFGTVLRHDDMDDILQEFSTLIVYAQRGDWDDYYGNCAALLEQIAHIGKEEQFKLHNIL